ncbi:hypothetical protein DD556_04825 [Phaeobacter sp. JL2872]|nr:hypothetical protein DD556_04825 [Phaeobacter sp. JL2872]
MGDPLGVLEDLVLDDVYMLAPGAAAPRRLSVASGSDGSFTLAEDSELGQPGAALHLDCALTLMAEAGPNVDALVMVEVDAEGLIAAVYLVPMAPLMPQTGYTLLKAERAPARARLAQMASIAFTRGTHITLATGAQKPIEDLRPGDRILTRDDGVQELRWIGQTTSRATGAMAPILIRKGTLNNARDLLVSPDHRLMVYQRHDALGAGTPELLVAARHLVNGDSVVVQDGGFVDYFQLLFDRHHIVYAEGIAAESLFLDPVTEPALPPGLLQRIADGSIPPQRRDSHGLDVPSPLLDRPNLVELLKRASLR